MADVKSIIVMAELKSAYTHKGAEDDKMYNYVSFYPKKDDVWKILDDLYKDAKDKWIPSFYKKREEQKFIKLKSSFDIPVKIRDTDDKFSFTDFIDRGLIRGAEISIKLNIKDQALYPVCIVVEKDGEEYDAFADM